MVDKKQIPNKIPNVAPKGPNQEIIGGIELAILKGIPLKEAMLTFYNSGYVKEEIEEAARIAQQNLIMFSKKKQIQEEKNKKSAQKIEKKKSKEFRKKKPLLQKAKSPVQDSKISQYGNKPAKNFNYSEKKPPKKGIFVLVIGLLVIAGGVLVFLLFKDQIISLLGLK